MTKQRRLKIRQKSNSKTITGKKHQKLMLKGSNTFNSSDWISSVPGQLDNYIPVCQFRGSK